VLMARTEEGNSWEIGSLLSQPSERSDHEAEMKAHLPTLASTLLLHFRVLERLQLEVKPPAYDPDS
jgi:hypothetical protein